MAVALIAGLPGIIAAVAALLVRREIHTGDGTTLGQAVEETQKHAADAHAIVRRTMGERKTDGAKPGGIHTDLERADD